LTKIDAHKRIIWTCSWSYCDNYFATGSRDKIVKIWAVRETEAGVKVQNELTLAPFRSSVTALSWGPGLLLAVGMEDGSLELWGGSLEDSTKSPKLNMACLRRFDRFDCHVAAVQRLAWRDVPVEEDVNNSPSVSEHFLLGSCGADFSLRLFDVKYSGKATH
jgi:elongator complex protein 2